MFFALVLVASLTSPSLAQEDANTLHSVELDETSYVEKKVDDESVFWQSVLAGTQVRHIPEEDYYHIRFTVDEPFEFSVAKHLIDLADKTGQTYSWDHDGDFDTPSIRMQIPNGVLNIRATLIASKRYWDAACESAQLKQVFMKEGPIRVWIPSELTKARPGSVGLSRYFSHEIMLWYPYGTWPATAAHEYFHLVQGAIWANGSGKRWHERWRERSRFFDELTATWSEDEPISIKRSHHSAVHTRIILDAFGTCRDRQIKRTKLPLRKWCHFRGRVIVANDLQQPGATRP